MVKSPFIELTISGVSDMPLFFISLEEIILNAGMNPEDVLIETPKHLPWNTLILSVYAGGILSYTKHFPAGDYNVACALIIGKRKESTDKKTSLNDVLREYNLSV